NDVLSGKVPLPPQTISVIQPGFQMPSTWQSMLGFQKQLSGVLGFDADLVYYKGQHEDEQLDPNVFYDPVTGFPKNPSRFGRPNPVNANGVWNMRWGVLLAGSFHYGSGNYSPITSPADPLGQVNGARRVLADLTVIPRNTFLQDPWQTLDVRVSKAVRVGTVT